VKAAQYFFAFVGLAFLAALAYVIVGVIRTLIDVWH